ncbi:MAG: PAS domain-containing protein [Candidatus Obscuribacterales bacterium]|nr:PAS domain-containing protein [Candidatus Obscuribacterales bacterium]
MSKRNTDPIESEKIYQAMHELEALTRNYIDGVLKSRDAAAAHARFLMAILDSIGDGLIVVDASKNILLANQAAIAIAGWEIANLSMSELRSRYKRFKEDGQTPLLEDEEPLFIALNEGRAVESIGFVTSPHLPPEGIWIRTIASPVKNENGEVIGGVTLFQDITKSVKLKKQRDALATLITHDLKNHLIAESGVLEVLADELSDEVDPEIKDMLTEQVAGNFKYLELASTLVELCRTEMLSTKDHMSLVAIPDLLNSAIDLNKQHLTNTGVEVILNMEPNLPFVRGIFPALQQVFHNLVQNAIFVSDEGETVTINAKRKDGFIEIEIADMGPGIPEEKMKTLFDPSTAATHVRTSSSTGVGLHLCRLLLDLHGGKLTCASEVDHGTSFFVDLPI